MRALHERTDGLPPYVAHVLNDLLARGQPDNGDASAATQLPRMSIPESLAGIVEHYVARLSSDERAVLEAAAVCGVAFRADTIAAALDRDAASIATVCGHLARGRLWLRVPTDDGNNVRELGIRSGTLSFGNGSTSGSVSRGARSCSARSRRRSSGSARQARLPRLRSRRALPARRQVYERCDGGRPVRARYRAVGGT